MRTITSLALALTTTAVVTASGCAHHAPEAKKINAADAPTAVRDAMERRFPGAEVISVEKEKENGAVVYDYELRQGGRKFETDIKADGTIMEVEKQLTGADIPDSVSRAVRAKYPNATVKEVMEVNKVSGDRETPDHYEVTLSGAGSKAKEVNVSMNGTISEEGPGHD